jgi:hypothetical protein
MGASIGNASPKPAKNIMSENALNKDGLLALFNEKNAIENWLYPKVDPNVWPPSGWEECPFKPGFYIRTEISEAQLRKELFNEKSPQDLLWEKQAKERLLEIEKILIPYFFPSPKDEGLQRKTKSGFATTLEMGLKRKIDEPVLDAVLESCEIFAAESGIDLDVESKVIEYKPALKLKEFRDLPDAIKKVFENALIITPDKAKFEIVKIEE